MVISSVAEQSSQISIANLEHMEQALHDLPNPHDAPGQAALPLWLLTQRMRGAFAQYKLLSPSQAVLRPRQLGCSMMPAL